MTHQQCSRSLARILVLIAAGVLLGAGALHGQSVQLTIPDTTGRKGDTLLVPIQVSPLATSDSVYSGQFTLTFSSGVIEILGVETSGSLSASIASVLYNTTTHVFAFAGTSIVTGTNPLVYLRIRIRDNPTKDTTTVAFANAQLNEGLPLLLLDGGRVRVLAIQISPKLPSPALIAGDALQFSVSGDAQLPLIWTSSDTQVGTVNSSGQLVTIASGQMKVHVQDAQGLQDSTNLFPVYPSEARDLTVSFHDTSWTQTLEFNVPVYISDVTPLGIIAAQMSVTYNNSIIQAVDVVQAGSMVSSWSAPSFNIVSGRIDLVLAGTTPLSGSGILVYVRFRVQPAASGSTTMNVTNALFNENLTADVVSGQMTALTAPTVVITPSSAVLTRGDVLTFQVTSGGTPPYTWTSTMPSVASIDPASGELTALTRGTTAVKVVDVFGFTRTSDPILVNDVDAMLPDTAMGLADSVDVPLFVEDMTGLNVLSFEARIVYDSLIVRPSDFITAGTMSNGFTVFLKDTLDTLRVVAAGTTPLASQGTLIKLRFKTTSLATGVTSALTLANLQFNEADPASPTATSINGSIAILAPPGTPALISPSDGATDTPRDLVLTWGSSFGTSLYRLQISTNSSFTSLVFDDAALLDTVFSSTPLAANTLHFWRVRAINAGGSSSFSSARSFTTGTTITSVRTLEGVPMGYELDQNFPNPFNPGTAIRFSLAQRSFVTITVYSILGNEIKTILSQVKDAGRFEVQFDAGELSSGVYFYVMRTLPLAGGSGAPLIMTKKMILLK